MCARQSANVFWLDNVNQHQRLVEPLKTGATTYIIIEAKEAVEETYKAIHDGRIVTPRAA